jgi:hypothetical protein
MPLDKKINKILCDHYGIPLYTVEVSINDANFPFKEFKKKPYQDSRQFDIDQKNYSWACFGYQSLSGARSFANKYKKDKRFSIGIFQEFFEVFHMPWAIDENDGSRISKDIPAN